VCPCVDYLQWAAIDTITQKTNWRLRLHETSGFNFVYKKKMWNRKIKYYLYPVMTSVCITLEYRTIVCYDARFDPKTTLVNMLWICRKGPPVIFDATIPHERFTNWLSVFYVNCYTDSFKIEFILQMYFYLLFYVVKCYIHTQSLSIHGKRILGKALLLFHLRCCFWPS